jgi:hypothetical protein
MIFDLGNDNRTEEQELLTNGYNHISNEPLAAQWVDYFKITYPAIRLIEY